ncbi:bifunctional lysylphosphatidylglycerol flippase/synthetase MprF [Bifidobacterium choloepi]|nr:DUF2156 domain-containing protein [Bifidobacterium choloepi]
MSQQHDQAHGPGDDAGAQLLRDFRRWRREQAFALWVTGGFIVINILWWLVFAVQHKSLPYNELSTDLGHFDFGKLIPSLFLTRGVFQLLVEAALMMLMLCLAEPILGAVRTIFTCIVSAVAGVFVGLLLCSAVSALLSTSSTIYSIPFTLSPVTLVVGGLMAATAFTGQLWRRRIRIVGYCAICVVLLYGGNPGDYCTLMAAVIGQLIGRALAGPPQTDQWHWQHASSYEARHILGAVGVVLALGPVVATTSRAAAGPLTTLALIMSPSSVNSGKLAACMHGTLTSGCFTQYELARAAMPGDVVRSLLPLVVMLVIAVGMYRGRRTAAWFAIIFYGASAIFTLCYYLLVPYTLNGSVRGFSGTALWSCVVNVAVPAAFAIVTAAELRHFSLKTSARAMRWGLIVVVVTFVACAAVYLLFAGLCSSQFSPRPSFAVVLADLPGRFLPIGFLTHTRLAFLPTTILASIVYQGVGIVFWAVLVVASIVWLRVGDIDDEHARSRAEQLVEAGGESMSFMTTWEGNDYWISHTGRSGVAYRVLNGVALTTTGPFGDPDEWMADLDDFSRFCSEHSWTPVFYAVHQNARDHLSSLGWHSLLVGEEMVIDPASWKTTGKKWQDIRTAINKAKRDGIVDEFTTYDECPHSVQRQFEEISEQWSEGKALPEMKFTLGGVEELKDPRVKVLYAIDADGTVQGVTSWLPTWRDGRIIGWTLDFMRHRTDSPNGIMEFLIARMAQRMHDLGESSPDEKVEFVSLSAAPLTGLDSSSDATSDDDSNVSGTLILQHALALVADFLEPEYGFKSLYNFKKKFQPAAYPVYLCYADPAKLANLGIAVLRAYLPNLTVRETLSMLGSMKSDK